VRRIVLRAVAVAALAAFVGGCCTCTEKCRMKMEKAAQRRAAEEL
jgi:hypothetical protein